MMPFDWTKIPTGRNYLYYGREEMDAFHEIIKAHIEDQDKLIENIKDHMKSFPVEYRPEFLYIGSKGAKDHRGLNIVRFCHAVHLWEYELLDLLGIGEDHILEGLRAKLEGRQN